MYSRINFLDLGVILKLYKLCFLHSRLVIFYLRDYSGTKGFVFSMQIVYGSLLVIPFSLVPSYFLLFDSFSCTLIPFVEIHRIIKY